MLSIYYITFAYLIIKYIILLDKIIENLISFFLFWLNLVFYIMIFDLSLFSFKNKVYIF